MKTFSIQIGVGAVAMALMLMSVAANARQTYDKGDLGMYERHGRFVHAVPTASSDRVSSTAGMFGSSGQAVTYDKGDRGTYVRSGRFVHRVVELTTDEVPSSTVNTQRTYRVVNHIQHKHVFPG